MTKVRTAVGDLGFDEAEVLTTASVESLDLDPDLGLEVVLILLLLARYGFQPTPENWSL